MNKRAKDIAVKFGIDSTNHKALYQLIAFAAQSPGLEYANYGDRKSYNQESRKISKHWKRFTDLVAEAMVLGLTSKDLKSASSSGDRLCWKNGDMDYTTGQYWCVEYRPAACRLLENAIRNHRLIL